MTNLTTHYTDGLDLLVSPVTFDTASGISTLVGAAVVGWAKNVATEVTYQAATCTVASATSIRAKWSPGSLPVGHYKVQIYATPVGGDIQTLTDDEVDVLEAAGP